MDEEKLKKVLSNYIHHGVDLDDESIDELKNRCSKNPKQQLAAIVHSVTNAHKTFDDDIAQEIIDNYF